MASRPGSTGNEKLKSLLVSITIPITPTRRHGAVIAALIVGSFVAPVCAQLRPPTNVEVLGNLAIGCIGSVPDTLSSFLLNTSGNMPYLRPRLTAHWQEQGHRVFLSDSSLADSRALDLHTLTYQPEEALVGFESLEDSQLKRTITLSIGHSLVAPSGLLLDDGRCRKEFIDTVSRGEVVRIQADRFPETRGEIPPEGSWKNWAEPMLLGATVGVVVYLFFSIRSK